jgi:hypothetical protein
MHAQPVLRLQHQLKTNVQSSITERLEIHQISATNPLIPHDYPILVLDGQKKLLPTCVRSKNAVSLITGLVSHQPPKACRAR